ncbi:MAG: sigma-70 family RNA polymerase sigma factor [Lachnospiraceae bacterium]|jgi:RNA polymerase sigma-70 factor (ECF subfamily)|nr:sigma-70 family RNA polymerase sigma factor [Lachnospiraceae bacterium]
MVTKEELAEVISENRSLLYGLAYSVTKNRHDAEDALGQAVVISFEKRETIVNKEKTKSWVSSVVYNESLKIIKERKNAELIENFDDLEEFAIEDKNLTPDKVFTWKKIFELPENHRTLLFMHYIEDLSIKEICKVFSAPEGTIKTRLRQARKALETGLKEGDEK